jgi:Mg2+-importing ATPase
MAQDRRGPFDFGRRRVSILAETHDQRLLIVKGAPEDVLRLCTSFEGSHGYGQPLTLNIRAAIRAKFEQLGDEGFRVLSVASRRVALDQNTAGVDDEIDLVFAGFAIFLDPPKASAANAIRAIADSEVAIKILTGDNERVACHLWRKLGISDGKVITGDELSSMSEEALIGQLSQVNLFCRVTPEQKLRVILALKRIGQTVGFLGDGINDAPALHSADVSISVDSAADVAKTAADIILLEKDLTVLHDGVVEGRRTVVNVDKYIRMAVGANFGNILSMAIAGLILPFLPLLPIQVLLTNLLYDFAQIGLPFDRVDPEAVEKPTHWNLRVIKRVMLLIGSISTMFDLATFGALVFIFQADQALFRTGWFIESLVTQILMIFAVRTNRLMFASRPHNFVAALAIFFSMLTIALPFLPLSAWFNFVAPPPLYFVFLLVAVLGYLAMIECTKRVVYGSDG